MFLAITILSIGVLVSHTIGQLPPKESQGCFNAMTSCINTHLTADICRNTWNSFLLEFNKNDRDVNCQADFIDYERDLQEYDLNGDGQMCKNEWTKYRVDHYGFTREFNVGYFEYWQLPTCTNASYFAGSPSDMETSYKPGAVQGLVEFCAKGDNQIKNRDCWNLPMICKEKVPRYAACGKMDKNILTLKEKLDLNQRTNDANGDGLVTPDEIKADLDNNYDVNKDGCTSKTEWVNRWTSFYGFSSEFGNKMYDDAVSSNTDKNCLKPDQFGSTNIDASRFPVDLIYTIIDMCQANSSLYATNIDCALVSDTCITYFPGLLVCRIYLNKCGLERYSTCLDNLVVGNGGCTSSNDRQEVALEKRRCINQITSTCIPAPYPGRGMNLQAITWLMVGALVVSLT